MKMHKTKLDDTLGVVLVAAGAVLAIGLQVSTSMGYALDRGSVQARADEQAKVVRLAEAASAAARRGAIAVAMRDKPALPAAAVR